MTNPRFLQTADRWKNEEVPVELPNPTASKKFPITIPDFDYSFLGLSVGNNITSRMFF